MISGISNVRGLRQSGGISMRGLRSFPSVRSFGVSKALGSNSDLYRLRSTRVESQGSPAAAGSGLLGYLKSFR